MVTKLLKNEDILSNKSTILNIFLTWAIVLFTKIYVLYVDF